MSHSILWSSPSLVAGTANLVGRYKKAVDASAQVNPTNATKIDFERDFQELRWAMLLIAHSARGGCGRGQAAMRNFNPGGGPLAQSVRVEIESMGGGVVTFRDTLDMEAVKFSDWLLDSPGHPLHGQPYWTRVMVFDWLEFDALTGEGWIDPEGNPGILVSPGWDTLITGVDWVTRRAYTWEQNLPDRAWSDDRPLYAHLWRFVQDPEEYDIGNPPLMVADEKRFVPDPGDPSKSVLNIERAVCRHDRLIPYNTEEEDGLGWRGSQNQIFFRAMDEQRRVCKTCMKVDALRRLDPGYPYNLQSNPSEYAPTSPRAIYPARRYAQEARIGIGHQSTLGALGHFCDGNGGACDGFEPQEMPTQVQDEVARHWLQLTEGLEVIGVQITGLPQIAYQYMSPPSMYLFGGFDAGLGGGLVGNAIVLPINGGVGFLDHRADQAGELVGKVVGALHRPWQGSASDSAIYRILGGDRMDLKSRRTLGSLGIDHSCDWLKGIARQMYSGSQILGTHNGLLNCTRRHTGDRGSRIWLVENVNYSENRLLLPGPVWPWRLYHDNRTARDVTAPITEVDGTKLIWRYSRGDGQGMHAVGGVLDFWIDNHVGDPVTTWWHNSIRRLAEVGDSLHFGWSAPAALRGRGFVITSVTKVVDTLNGEGEPETGHDEIQLMASGGETLDLTEWADDLEGATITVYSHRCHFYPLAGAYSVRRMTGSGPVVDVTSTSQIEPCGVDLDGDDDVDAHVVLSASEVASRGPGPHAYEVAATQVVEGVNYIDATDITEVRQMLGAASPMALSLGASEIVHPRTVKGIFFQKGGPDDPEYWYLDNTEYPPGSGEYLDVAPCLYGEHGPVPLDMSSGSGNLSFVHQVSPSRQDKYGNIVVYTLPDWIHLPGPSNIVSAYVWVKGSVVSAHGMASNEISAAIVRRLLVGESMCIRAHEGTCPSIITGAVFSGGLHGLHCPKHGHFPLPLLGHVVNPDPDALSFNPGASHVASNCARARGWRTDLHGQYTPLPETWDNGYVMDIGNRPYCLSKYYDVEAGGYIYRDIVEPTLAAAQQMDEQIRLDCPGFSPARWSQPLGAANSVSANGEWQQLDITDAVKTALGIGREGQLGIAFGWKEVLQLGLNGTSGTWLAPAMVYGPNHPNNGGTDDYDKVYAYPLPDDWGPSPDPLGDKAIWGEMSLDVAGPIVVEYALTISPRRVCPVNLPGRT